MARAPDCSIFCGCLYLLLGSVLLQEVAESHLVSISRLAVRKKVPAIFNMSPHDSPCPFCARCFVRLGSHLPQCRERNGRYYSAFLAARKAPSSRGVCSSCGRRFKRLDTHLRVSSICRVVDCSKPQQSLRCERPPTPDPTPSPMNSIPLTTDSCTTSTHHFKHPLRLPKATDEWEEADQLLSAVTAAVSNLSRRKEYLAVCRCV